MSDLVLLHSDTDLTVAEEVDGGGAEIGAAHVNGEVETSLLAGGETGDEGGLLGDVLGVGGREALDELVVEAVDDLVNLLLGEDELVDDFLEGRRGHCGISRR